MVRQKLGMILENKVVQKLKLEVTKNGCPSNFDTKKLTLKIQFWHFLMNHNSLTDVKKKNSFEYVDSWPKILLSRNHHL